MQLSKNMIRYEMIEKRNNLDIQQVVYKSNLIINKLTSLREFQISKFILLYLDFKNEVSTKNLLDACLCQNKRIAVPYVISKEKGNERMVASEVKDIKKEFAVGSYGILEPKRDYIREIDVNHIDLVVVPGVAFDFNLNRIGYGAGYYDRFLKNSNKNSFKIGIAYDFQVVDNLPSEKNDIP